MHIVLLGTAYPFRGGFKYIMVNAATGEFIIEQYTLISVTQEDEDGNATSVYVPDWNETKESKKISTGSFGKICCTSL